jgi:hypothetical protein
MSRPHTVSTHHDVRPLPSLKLRHVVPGPSSEISILAFFSSPPDAAMMMRAPLVTMTSRWRFLVVLPDMKKRENLRGASCDDDSAFLTCGLCGCGDTVTTRLPSCRMRSFWRVSTGDHSMSSCEGAGSSVMRRAVCGREGVMVVGAEVVGAAASAGPRPPWRYVPLSRMGSAGGTYGFRWGAGCFHSPRPHLMPSQKGWFLTCSTVRRLDGSGTSRRSTRSRAAGGKPGGNE